jgi:hypothetical protein
MENILSEFSVKNLSIKLTDEKLFIITPSASETFALRSLNGIGVIDLVEKYNEDMNKHKEAMEFKLIQKVSGFLMAIFTLIVFYFMMKFEFPIGAIITLFLGGGLSAVFFKRGFEELENPVMLSAVRIMLNSGNRDFEFSKTSKVSDNVAHFVAKVESTLSAYHKNNS